LIGVTAVFGIRAQPPITATRAVISKAKGKVVRRVTKDAKDAKENMSIKDAKTAPSRHK
jgi:hypothetical protein